MSLFKRVLFYMLLFSALILGIWAYLELKNSKKPREAALNRIPAGCLFYARTNDLVELNNRLNSRSLITDEFTRVKSCKLVLDLLDEFCNLADSNEKILEIIRANDVHFAFYPQIDQWLLVFNLKELGTETEFRQSLASLLKASELQGNIYRFALASYQPIFLKTENGLVSLSSSSELINRLDDASGAKLCDQPEFREAQKGFEEQGLLSLYFDHSLYAQKTKSAAPKLNLLNTKGFSSGNLLVQPAQLSLNGFLKPDSASALATLLNQRPQVFDLAQYLPPSTTGFKAFGFNNYSLINQSISDSHTKEFWHMASDSALFNIEQDFYKNLKNALVEFSVSGHRNPFLLVTLNDSLLAGDHLGFMSDAVHTTETAKIYTLRSTQNNFPPLFQPLSRFRASQAFIFNQCLYLCKSEADANALYNDLKSGISLENNLNFMQYAQEQFPEDYNLLIYKSSASILNELPVFFPAVKSTLLKHFEDLKHMSFSLSSREHDFKMRWQLSQETPHEQGGEKMLWSLELDTLCTARATAFINHHNGEPEILVQDEGKTLYLISSKGKVIWKKKLAEKIGSEIFVVDMFRNNKFQILFNTSHHLHLIDRNGNYVQSYPLKTPAKITSGISVFDYENKKDYRILFGCENRKIYNYTLYGLRQEGFTPFQTEAAVHLPIQFAKVGASDYLFALDREGKIYAFSRKGEGRMSFRNRAITNCKSFVLDPSNNNRNSWFIYLDDKSNLLHKISFSDTKEILNLKTDGEILGSRYQLVDENRDPDLILVTPGTISAYNLNSNRIVEFNNRNALDLADYYSDESHAFYFAHSKSGQELFVYDPQQQITKLVRASAMPLICDLFRNKKLCLVYPEKRNLNCMLY